MNNLFGKVKTRQVPHLKSSTLVNHLFLMFAIFQSNVYEIRKATSAKWTIICPHLKPIQEIHTLRKKTSSKKNIKLRTVQSRRSPSFERENLSESQKMQNFLVQVPKNFIGGSFGVSKSFWQQKTFYMRARGGVSRFLHEQLTICPVQNFRYTLQGGITKKMLKTFHATEKISEGDFLVFRKVWHRKNSSRSWDRFFCLKAAEKFRKRTLWGFRKFLVSESVISRILDYFFVSQCRKSAVEGTCWHLWVLARACYTLYLDALKQNARGKSRKIVVIFKIFKKK